MEGTCEVCGASNVEVRQTKTDDGQLKTLVTSVDNSTNGLSTC